MVVIPAIIHHPSQEKFCIHVSSLPETVHLAITLEMTIRNHTLVEKDVEKPGIFECISFQVNPGAVAAAVDSTLTFKSNMNLTTLPAVGVLVVLCATACDSPCSVLCLHRCNPLPNISRQNPLQSNRLENMSIA